MNNVNEAVKQIIDISGTNVDPEQISEIMRKAAAPPQVPEKVLPR
jgi:hypothetical protein